MITHNTSGKTASYIQPSHGLEPLPLSSKPQNKLHKLIYDRNIPKDKHIKL